MKQFAFAAAVALLSSATLVSSAVDLGAGFDAHHPDRVIHGCNPEKERC